MKDDLSIHPRVFNGRTVAPKENTCKTADPNKRARTIAALEAYCEEHPNNKVAAGHLAKLKAL
jgi:hypothetical protein